MKRIGLSLIMLLGVLAVRAGNTLSVTSASGHPQDEVTLHVSLANTDAAVALQAEIPLGSQLTYVPGSVSLNPARVTDHQVTAAVVNGNLRIYVFSLSLTPFVGSQGNLLSFTLKLKNEPGVYPISLSNAILSSATSTALSLTTQNGQVTILSPKLQINTTTIDYGHVPIRSEYTQNANVINVGNEPLTITGITFNDPVFSCPNFTQKTLQPNGSANFTFKFAPMVKGAVTATATVASNSIAGNGVISLVADPFAVNELHIDYVTGYCDSIVEVPITMNNMESIIGFQIDMNLPEQLEFVDFTLGNRKTDHVSTGVFNEGVLRLMAYSPSGAAFTGDDGLIGTLRLKLQGLYGNYYLNPFKAVLADANGENVLSAQYQGRVTIRSPRINGNASLDMGSTPVTESVTKEYVVNNNGNASMRIDQVVFDQLGFSVSESFPIIVPQNTSTTLHVSYDRELAGDFTALMKIYSNDPQNGLKNVTLQGHRYEPNTLELAVETGTAESDVDVSIQLQNYSDLVALQLNFSYPYPDYTVGQEDFTLTDRFSNHSLYVIPLNDSTYRLFVVSMQNRLIEGHEGEAIKVTMHPVGVPSMEQDYEITVSEVILSNPSGVNLASESEKSLVFRLALTHLSELPSGWNWFSSYIEYDANTLSNIQNAIAETNTSALIKDQRLSTSLSINSQTGELAWTGNLPFVNEQMYMINLSDGLFYSMTGTLAKSTMHPVTLSSGWNWIPFLSPQAMTLTDALANINPSNGDQIKNQSNSSTYNSTMGWVGKLSNLIPGGGYMYYHQGPNITLVYPAFSKDVVVEPDVEEHWDHDVHRFPTNLTMIVTLDDRQLTMGEGSHEIGAFVNDDCRGSARLQKVLDSHIAFLTISGEEGEEISFRLYNADTDEEYAGTAEETISYVSDAIHGSIEKPVTLHFRNTGVNEHHEISLFPNPTMGKVTVKAVGMNRLAVTNVLGQVVYDTEVKADQMELDLTNCESGLYLIHVNAETFTVVRRLMLAK